MTKPPLQPDAAAHAPSTTKAPEPLTTDIIIYAGQVNRSGYDLICNELGKAKSSRAVLVLATPGGDPHAGFRIARALQHKYGDFDALVPRFCKSAGTLIVIGARRLFLGDRSELGPLDVQIKKGDELEGVNSPMAGSNSPTCGQSNSSGQDGVDYESCVVLTASREAASLSL